MSAQTDNSLVHGKALKNMLWVEEPDTKKRIRVVPGEFRQRDVRMGRHIPISSGVVPRF